MKTVTPLISAIVFGLCVAQPAQAAGDAVVTAVFSNVSNGYERQKLPDGSFKHERYALANGQYAQGTDANPSIDKVSFPTIAGLVAGHLAKQNYFLAQSAKSADILLVISWGTTVPYTDNFSRNSQDHALSVMNEAQEALKVAKAAEADTSVSETEKASATGVAAETRGEMEDAMVEIQALNAMRRQADEHNARLLGYTKEINDKDDLSRYAGGGAHFDDLISDIEEERYYIVISAYDFKSATKEGKRKLLWSTRVSVRTQGNRFDEQLKTMLANASGYFGQDSHHLVRQYHSGTVRMDDLKYTSVTPESTDSTSPGGKK